MTRRITGVIISSLVLVLFLLMGRAQSQAIKPVAAMPQEEAFQILNALNDKNMLLPQSLMAMSAKYMALRNENCFGLEPVRGWKIAAESTGKNKYGIEFKYAGDPSATVQIGFFYSSAPFRIADKPMAAGAYAVLANIEKFQLTGNAGTFHWERDRQVPDTRTEQTTLSNKLAPRLFESKSIEGPRFSFVQEGKGVFIALGENKLPLRKQ